MNKCLLIIAGIFITVFFCCYILDMGCSEWVIRPGDWPGNRQATDLEAAEPFDNEPSITANLEQPAPLENKTVIEDGWELVWSDDFDRPYLDPAKWNKVDRLDNYNHELQSYTANNSYIKDGALYLTARQENQGDKKYTSALVETKEKLSFCYGKIEARIKLPLGKGLFPAFWLLSYSGKAEIDIMEMIGSEPQLIYGVYHYLSENKPFKTYGLIEIEEPEQFHIYCLEWEKDELRWSVDNTVYHRSDRAPSENMYIILNLAVGGDWPGYPDQETVFPAALVLDYINLYRRSRPQEHCSCFY